MWIPSGKRTFRFWRANMDVILGNLVKAVKIIEGCKEFTHLIPEVRTNICYGREDAHHIDDVAAIEGRISIVNGMPRACGYPAYGASSHLARFIIEVKKYADYRAAINFKYDEKVHEFLTRYTSESGFDLGEINRKIEPDEVAGVEGKSIPWKIAQLMEKYGTVPRVVYETAGWGKEPLTVVMGKHATEVAQIAVDIARKMEDGEYRV